MYILIYIAKAQVGKKHLKNFLICKLFFRFEQIFSFIFLFFFCILFILATSNVVSSSRAI